MRHNVLVPFPLFPLVGLCDLEASIQKLHKPVPVCQRDDTYGTDDGVSGRLEELPREDEFVQDLGKEDRKSVV